MIFISNTVLSTQREISVFIFRPLNESIIRTGNNEAIGAFIIR